MPHVPKFNTAQNSPKLMNVERQNQDTLYLLDKGADPWGEMLEGITCPLAEAVVGHHVGIARLLLECGAFLNNICLSSKSGELRERNS